jgi:hypothetical protein
MDKQITPEEILLKRFGCRTRDQLFSSYEIDFTCINIIIKGMYEYAELARQEGEDKIKEKVKNSLNKKLSEIRNNSKISKNDKMVAEAVIKGIINTDLS